MPEAKPPRERPSLLAMLSRDDVLAIEPHALERIAADPSAYVMGDDERECKPYDCEGGIATIAVEGVLCQRAWSFWFFSCTGYDALLAAVEQACDDPAVKAIVLHCDSPGGEVAGLFDAVRAMRAAIDKSGKRCVAISDEDCFSAAYAVACVADEIVVPETAGVGSVGVISSLVSFAKANEAEGIDVRVIASGAEKTDWNRNVPITDGAVERVQARVDECAGIFARWVAERRGMSPEAVLSLNAGLRYGGAAVASGLANRVAPAASAIASLRQQYATPASLYGALYTTESSQMDALKTLLGLEADAPDARVIERVTALASLERDVLAATKAADPAAARVALVALEQSAATAQTMAAELATLRVERENEKRAAMLQAARDDGRLTPAIEASESWKAIVTGSTEALAATLAVLPKQIAVRSDRVEPRGKSEAAEGDVLSDDEKRYAKAAGLTEAQLVASKRNGAARSRVVVPSNTSRPTEDEE